MSKPLTIEQRYVISTLPKRKISLSEIAKEIGRNVSTIYREINRDSCKNGHYCPTVAPKKAMERMERIYQAIRADETGETRIAHTAWDETSETSQSQKVRSENIPNRISIHDRPAETDGKRFGDWEMDLIVDPQQNTIVTLTRTNFILMERLPEGKKAAPLAKTVVRRLFAWSVKTITTDNGGEFAAHAEITKGLHRKSLPDFTVYFADPYAS